MIKDFSRSDFRLSFNNEKYLINSKKGTVSCRLDCHINCPVNEFVNFNTVAYNELNFSIVGTSVCSSDDLFDESLGKKIARTKAESKAYAKAARFVKKVADMYSDALLMAGAFQEKAKATISHNEGYLSSLEDEIKPRPKKEYVAPDAKVVEKKPESTSVVTSNDGRTKTFTKHIPNGTVKVTKKKLTQEEAVDEFKRMEQEFEEFEKRMNDFRKSFGLWF